MAAGEEEAAWGARPAKLAGARPVEPTRKFMACLRKYLLAYLRVLGALGDLDTLQARVFVRWAARASFKETLQDLAEP